MARYICLDGPLEGRAFDWRRPPVTGQSRTVAIVDVGNGVLEVDYRLRKPADEGDAGRLEFVSARDLWRTSWRHRSLPRVHL